MKAARMLRARIDAEQITTGVLLTCHLWAQAVEVLQSAGLDYAVIDMEHGAFNDELVTQVCAAGRRSDFAVLIRPIDSHYSTIRRAIDFGPCGLLVPGVESTDQLDTIRDGIYMPPRGRRRPGGAGNRWVRDFNYPTWKREVEDDFIVLPQIETQRGLDQVEAIASHEITTAIAIGPYDLSASLGCCWDPTDQRHIDAVARIRQAGRDAGKNMWHIGDAATLVSQGFTFLCVGEPMMMMEQALATANAAAKQQGSTPPPSAEPMP